KTYSKHTDLSNTIAVRQNEFSYLKLGGWVGKKDFIFMTQVDPLGGTYADTGFEEPHTPTSNTMNAFTVTYENLQSMDEVSSHKVEMMVYPNPAENHFKVDFVGVCNIELYNVLGQKVYSVENVAGPYMISTEKFSKGIYFVTVRDGKKMTTQKLIVQ
ncbi:MAG: T9SS type A sorting domain-containing protein, partial [Bacteroidales bacterium]|nr:T9SS type A sorting domain-containing protein [Bacteroidales bacterium]